MPLRPFAHRSSKTVTFDGTSGKGLQTAAVPIFTVTHEILVVSLVPYCLTNLAGTNATLALGVTGSTSLFLGATTATDIDAGKFWLDTSPSEAGGIAVPAACRDIAITADIIGTIGTADITGGAIRFDLLWVPLVKNAEVQGP